MSRTWLLIPGLALGPRHFERVRERLGEADSRVVVMDQWDVPLTASPEVIWERYALPTTSAEGETVGLVGHSMGGLTALRLAQSFPKLIDRVLLLDPSPAQPLRKAARSSAPAVAPSGELFHRPWLGGRWRTPVSVVVHEFLDFKEFSACVHARLDTLDLPYPIVQMTGMRASANLLREQRETAEALGARLIGLRGCGHLIARHRPQAVADALLGMDSDELLG